LNHFKKMTDYFSIFANFGSKKLRFREAPPPPLFHGATPHKEKAAQPPEQW